MSIVIQKLSSSTLDLVVPVFNQYREYYQQEIDVAAQYEFLQARLGASESVIFVAVDNHDGEAAGFTQLYPSFSSLAMRHIWVLNDLYVCDNKRRLGCATALLNSAVDFAGKDGAYRIRLETEPDNSKAQSLYERCGWLRLSDIQYYHSL